MTTTITGRHPILAFVEQMLSVAS